MIPDEFQPTIVHESSPSGLASMGSSVDASKANVGLVAGRRPKFAEETAQLLRQRLTAAAIVITVVLAVAFLGSLINGILAFWWLRALVLAILLGCTAALRSVRQLSLSHLRIMELAVFGVVIIQVTTMLMTRLAGFVAEQDAVSVVGVEKLFLGAWCLVIFIYGIFMPNSWQRSAVVTVSMALVPYAAIGIQRWWMPELAAMLGADKTNAPLPLPLVAAVVATYAAHTINSARREAFKAKQLGQYRLMDRLGGGGMGVVYKAEHVLLKRPCAIKLIKPESDADATAIAQFEKEVKLTAKLTHWNTVEIYDYGHADDGTFYYVMELLPGMSLEELVRDHGPLPPERVVHLLRQVCGALQEAHDVGLIHRDIKPANIFAAQRGGVCDVAKLLDFGLVKDVVDRPDLRGQVTKQGSFSGTPLYMSPEQASTYDEVDGRADLYSLGAVAYHLLTGQPPFSGSNLVELLAAHARSEVVAPSTLNTNVPKDLDEVVLRCLAKTSKERFADAAALEQALAGCACACQWTAERAAEWWESRDTARTVGSSSPTAVAEVTIDYEAGDK